MKDKKLIQISEEDFDRAFYKWSEDHYGQGVCDELKRELGFVSQDSPKKWKNLLTFATVETHDGTDQLVTHMSAFRVSNELRERIEDLENERRDSN